jgi:hypothetical protein
VRHTTNQTKNSVHCHKQKLSPLQQKRRCISNYLPNSAFDAAFDASNNASPVQQIKQKLSQLPQTKTQSITTEKKMHIQIIYQTPLSLHNHQGSAVALHWPFLILFVIRCGK